ncbi:MAG: helix-hairpin-helix domain-containing protein [Clostridiales bacterium]|nr:helix-hairpin-helix domain-containing protein [Clostridiales bacterium]
MKKFSLKEHLMETFRDEGKRKSFLVGVVVFVVVFVGLTLYRQASEVKQAGDLIVTNGGSVVEQGGYGSGSEDGSDVFSGEGVDGSDGSALALPDDGGGADPAMGYASTEPATIFVDVGGAVQLSGLFALPAGSRVADAIDAAGGLRDEADVKYINRAALLGDGDRLYIPTEAEVRDGTAPPTAGQVLAGGGSAASSSQGGSSAAPSSGGSDNSLINLNTADSDELQKLSGVGPSTAQKIIDYRTKRGEFKRIEDLMNVSGIGAKTFEKLRDHITV